MQSQTEHTKQEIGRARACIGVRVLQRCLIKWLHYTTSVSTSDTPTNKRIQTATDMMCSPHITELEYMPLCRALIKYTADIKLSNPTGHNQNIAGFHSGEGAFTSPWVTAIWCNSASYKKSLIQATNPCKKEEFVQIPVLVCNNQTRTNICRQLECLQFEDRANRGHKRSAWGQGYNQAYT